MARVSLEQVWKRFGDVAAVADLTLEARDGEFLVLVGPSGCGKSTALRMIAGLEDASEGEIFIGDRRVNNVPAKDRDIAMVFQSYALYPHMTVRENMAFGLKLRGLPGDEIGRRVEEAAAMLGLEPLLARRPRQLSGGQRQRVAVGRAIVREPRAFLFDEPLSNLDAKLRVQTRADLIRLHNRLQTTTIYVTHDQVEAMTMGSRIAVMNAGRLQQLDTPRTVYEHPVNTFVAGFIGSPAMTMTRMGVTVDGDGVRLMCEGVPLTVPARMREILRPYAGREVIVGLRPEDIAADRGEVVIPCPFPAVVDVVEMLGSESLLIADGLGVRLVARVPSDYSARTGDRITLYADAERLHLFDPETETNLAVARMAQDMVAG